MNWVKGRQGTGYEKLRLLVSSYFKFDVYLLKFKKGSYIDTHTDPVKEGRHFRLNIILKNAYEGGEFVCKNTIFSNSFINYFRPDISEHGVTRIDSGVRYVLSIGWIKK